jgi:hypothetical protein
MSVLTVLALVAIGATLLLFKTGSSIRRCATRGCTGSLPAGKGKHCPRCGGTNFQRPGLGRRRAWLLLMAGLGIAAIAIVIAKRTAVPIPPERRALIEAHDLASRMTMANARDDAYEQIVHGALAHHDFEYACQVSGEMVMSSSKDKCLLAVVEEALKTHQQTWAIRAADEMVMTSSRDDAYKKIMDAATHK